MIIGLGHNKEETKVCTKCGQVQPLSEFGRSKHHKNGRNSRCKPCMRKLRMEVHRRHQAERPEEYRLYMRNARLRSMYGITHRQYEELLAAQGGGCAICGSTEPGGSGKHFHVDHDHETGEVRGLLCSDCNTGLGKFSDSTERLGRAALYLEGRT